jgi:hypothetical protein
MARERIQNEHDAREARDDHHKAKRHKNNVTVHAGPNVDHSMSGVDMHGFELDPDAMVRTLGRLASLRQELQSYQTKAAHLAAPLPDGGGLVAHQMRSAYLDRADHDNGVQAVLREYLEELDSVEDTIRSTLEAYLGVDARAATDLRAGEVM